MDWAVVRLGGKQYLVKPGSRFTVSGVLGKTGDTIEPSEVLLAEGEGKVAVGTPLLSGVKIKAKIVWAGKGEKRDIIKFKAKSRYRRKMGFRPRETKLEINSVTQ